LLLVWRLRVAWQCCREGHTRDIRTSRQCASQRLAHAMRNGARKSIRLRYSLVALLGAHCITHCTGTRGILSALMHH
jgi:hypothetical protein